MEIACNEIEGIKSKLRARNQKVTEFLNKLHIRYKKLIMLYRPLNTAIPKIKPKINDPTIRIASRKEAETFKDYEDSWNTRNKILQFIDQGYELCIVSVGGIDTSYLWIQYQKISWSYLKAPFILPPNTCRIATVFTKPEFRGLGLASYNYSYAFGYLQKRGISRVFLEVEANNTASLKALRPLGFTPYLRLSYIQLVVVALFCLSDGKKHHFYPGLWKKIPYPLNRRLYPGF